MADVTAALDGARAILVERFAEDADLIGTLRERMWAQGSLIAKVREGKAEEGKKYSDYFDFAEPFGRLKAHRVLAMFRAEKEEILDLTLDPNDEGFDAIAGTSLSASYEQPIAERFGIMDHGWPADKWLTDTVRWAWRTRILVHLGIDLRMRLWQSAEAEAVDVFAANLRDLLLAAPAGQRATMGLDPGFRTGVKVAVDRPDRQGRRDPHDLPARPPEQVGRVARDPEEPGRRSTTSSSSRSATAPPRARPTSSRST